jgi:hypothetical protein
MIPAHKETRTEQSPIPSRYSAAFFTPVPTGRRSLMNEDARNLLKSLGLSRTRRPRKEVDQALKKVGCIAAAGLLQAMSDFEKEVKKHPRRLNRQG